MSQDIESDGELDGETRDRSDQGTLARGDSAPRPAARKPLLAAGQSFGGYRLLSVLGKGGFGQVWEAESLDTSRRLALKVLTEKAGIDESARQRFEREGRLAAAVSHARCVYVFGAEEIEGCPVISMELVAGGTLQDEVKRRGALPFKEAVDRVLDVLEGLEAALAKGVIHRDVKPSNCFLDRSGRVKIGDFGLSRTLEVDTKLTTTGVFMGTPAYSSPEQIRAETLDFRADLYSAGATLYTLLAGEVPYPGSQLGPVMARILADPAPPLSRPGTHVPLGLERVVQRLMARARDKRYPSYAAARAALAPYSSQGLMAASLGKRGAAILIDTAVLMPATLLVATWRFGLPFSQLLSFIYFLALEGRWGASVGKRLFGLRVVDAAGGEASWGAVALRAAVYVLIMGLHVWIRFLLSDAGVQVYTHSAWPPVLTLASIAVVAAPMRRRNLFAGLHEWASHTRVITLPERFVTKLPRGAHRTAPSGDARAFGPFVVEGVLWEHGGELVALARDPILDRPVFVHRMAAGHAARTIAILAQSSPGQPNWLQGSRATDAAWDAFEAPDGLSLVDWVKARGRLSWGDVAPVLGPLLLELQRRHEDGGNDLPLSLDHVWVDGLGQGRLLDFALRDPSGADAADRFPPAEWQAFLAQLLLYALEGRLVARSQLTTQPPRVPLAEHARQLVDLICSGPEFHSPAEVSGRLAATADRPADVDVARRGAALALAGIGPALAVFSGLMLTLWSGPLIEIITLGSSLKKHMAAPSPATAESATRREALERLVAHYSYRVKSRAEAEVSGAGAARNPLFQATRPEQFLEQLSAEQRLVVETLAARGGPLAAADLSELHRTAGVTLVTPAIMGAFAFAFLGLPSALVGVLLAGLTRGGLALRLGGIAVQKMDGSRPSRWRCLWRGCVAWLPFAVCAPVFLTGQTAWMAPAWIGTLLVVGPGVIYALARPSCGLQDRAAGTRLVPR